MVLKRNAKHKTRWAVLCVVVGLTIAITVPIANAQPIGGPTKATEIGISSTSIRIAVIADVVTPVFPGLFQGSRDAVQGFANYINATGGLAGRKLVVDFIDSHLSDSDARNAIIKACSQDFAMVGTAALFLNNVDDQLACKDQSGQATGLPDIPFITSEVVQQCSPDTFPVSPPELLCSTKDHHPQTYQASVGRAFYYQGKFGKNLHGVYVFPNDLKSARDSAFASGLGQIRSVGVKSDEDFNIPTITPQGAYTPIVETIKNRDATYAQAAGPFSMTVALRKEAQIQGVTSVKVWDCGTQCYDPQLLQQGGTSVEGQYVDTLYLPFLSSAERNANRMLANFFNYVGPTKVGELGAPYSWIAAVAFRDAVNGIVKTAGVNGLARKALLDQLNKIHSFNADGMYSPTDLAGRTIGPCHVLNQVQHGQFVRVFPTKPGTFDCPKTGVIQPRLDLLSGS